MDATNITTIIFDLSYHVSPFLRNLEPQFVIPTSCPSRLDVPTVPRHKVTEPVKTVPTSSLYLIANRLFGFKSYPVTDCSPRSLLSVF